MKLGKYSISDEKKTVKVMIAMYCNSHHNTSYNTLCLKCKSLLEYSHERVDNCPFGFNKPSCEKCTVHCYKIEQREEIKKIMGYSGPRMLFKYPILTIKHLLRKKTHK